MECDVCMQHFDSAERRPKVLPCGHTYCLQCLERLPRKACPVDQKVFELDKLLDNFKLLNIGSAPRKPARFWCIACEQEATEQCLDTHDVRSLKVQRLKETELRVKNLLEGYAAVSRLAEFLDSAGVGRQMLDCRDRLDAEGAHLAAARLDLENAVGADSAVWEYTKAAAVQCELSLTAAELATDLSSPDSWCSVTVRRGNVKGQGNVKWQGEVRLAGDAAARLLLSSMACQGSLRPPQQGELEQRERVTNNAPSRNLLHRSIVRQVKAAAASRQVKT